MLGTIVNTSTIIAGSVLGSVFRQGIKENYKKALFDALGLATVALGANAVVSNMPQSRFPSCSFLVWRWAALSVLCLYRRPLPASGRAVQRRVRPWSGAVYGNTAFLYRDPVYSGADRKRAVW